MRATLNLVIASLVAAGFAGCVGYTPTDDEGNRTDDGDDTNDSLDNGTDPFDEGNETDGNMTGGNTTDDGNLTGDGSGSGIGG